MKHVNKHVTWGTLLPCAIHLVFKSINMYCTLGQFHIALFSHVLEKFLCLKCIPADLKLDQRKKRLLFFKKYFSEEGVIQFTLSKVAKNVCFMNCIPNWSLSCHLILNLLSY